MHPHSSILPDPGPKMGVRKIERILRDGNIPLQEWGQGPWHSFREFANYMRNDRFTFQANGSGPHMPLTVDIHVVVVRVYYRNLELYEIKKTHREDPSRELVRHHIFDGVGETVKREHQPDLREAQRCLAEELGWDDPSRYTMLDRLGRVILGPRDHDKFKGIKGRWYRNIFNCIPSEQLFDPEGYVRPDGEWYVHFGWRDRTTKKPLI